MSDSAAFHEVDEAVRKDELKEWWGRYGTWVVAAAVLVVVVVAGLVGWRQYDAAAARRGERRLFGGVGQDRPGSRRPRRAEFEKQARSAPEPYRSLAAMIAAQLREPLEAQVAALTAVAPTLAVRRTDRPRQRDRRLQEHRLAQGRGDGGQARAAGRARPAVPAERASNCRRWWRRARATPSAPASCGREIAKDPAGRRKARPSAPRPCSTSTAPREAK